MSRLCADDIAIILRAAKFLSILAPIFRDADKFAGLRRKPSKRKVVLIGRAREVVAAELAQADVGWKDFRVGEAGKYLGIFSLLYRSSTRTLL